MYTLLPCTQFQTDFLYVYEPHFKVNVTRQYYVRNENVRKMVTDSDTISVTRSTKIHQFVQPSLEQEKCA